MNPSARLRTRPRSASDKLTDGCPSTVISPPEGASNPPSRCSSVLLPEPDAPTIATLSPLPTSRSMPSNTGTSCGPWWNVLRSPRARITGSLIAQRLGRIDARGAEAWIQSRKQAQHQRDARDRDHIAPVQVGRQIADVVDRFVEKLRVEHAFDRRHH